MDGTQPQNGPGHDWGGYVAIEPPPPPGVFEVGLVLAGASAGSMPSAIAAVALKYTFPHVPATPNDANPFYKAWVRDIDISKLTLTEDRSEEHTSELQSQ